MSTLFFPPVIAGAAEGLRHAVHCLAFKSCYLFVLAAIQITPWGEEEQAACSTEGDALLGGMVAVGKAVVGD